MIAADRNTIAAELGTDSETTHRILCNLNWGFFVDHFGDLAEEKWAEAHPIMYPDGQWRDYFKFDIDFIRKHFDLFSKNQFQTSAGWGPLKDGKYQWVVTSNYVQI